jgi:hypothetical protein
VPARPAFFAIGREDGNKRDEVSAARLVSGEAAGSPPSQQEESDSRYSKLHFWYKIEQDIEVFEPKFSWSLYQCPLMVGLDLSRDSNRAYILVF